MNHRHFLYLLVASVATSVIAGNTAEAGKTYTQAPEIVSSQVKGEAKPAPKPKDNKSAELLRKGPKADWIWGPGNANYTFSHKFDAAADSAVMIATCDNGMSVKLNGETVLTSSEWQSPVTKDISKLLKKGANEIVIDATNEGGVAALAVKIALTSGDKTTYIVSDTSWQVASKEGKKVESRSLGKMGVGPWGDVFSSPQSSVGSAVRDVFFTQPGFQVERLFTVPKSELGSWVSITFDDQGRLLASDQGKMGISRITPPAIGKSEPTKVEHLDVRMTSAQGMLYHDGGVYFSANGGPGSGLYRAEAKGDGFTEPKLLRKLNGGGEHGPHAVRLGPDGKSLYVIAGNHTAMPEFDSSRIPAVWQEDLLLPRQWDARGHARGKLAPGGWICKTDLAGKSWEVFSMGYRNPYDMDFNENGELFAYDADMEWDMGTPWYRPTRVVHATSGSEFGWRSGAGKWPTYYYDSLPPAVDIGPGSPVGVEFGHGAKFPAKYQKALYILDWTFGTMYAIHLTPDGASYKAEKEEFLSRTPLPLTDAAVGPDGALYFTVGGRGAQSELFRVTYVGDESTAAISPAKITDATELRHRLEELHTKAASSEADMQLIQTGLASEDRHVRYAARIALEHAPIAKWANWSAKLTDANALLEVVAALARAGDESHRPAAMAALAGLKIDQLSADQQLKLLRAYPLVFMRLGAPTSAEAAAIAGKLDAIYPAKDNRLNRELAMVLVYLKSPLVIEKTLALMKDGGEGEAEDIAPLLTRNSGYGGSIAKMLANHPDLQQIHYAYQLRNLTYGWTLDQRRAYFKHLDELGTKSGGASYNGFINNIRQEAIDNMLPAERAALESSVTPPPAKIADLPKAVGPGKKWTVSELTASASELKNRDFENGRRMFAAAQCARCHRFAGAGGATGPDLTNVAGRFQVRDLAEAIVEPSKVISDQYQATVIELDSGKIVTGRVTNESADGVLTVLTDPVDVTKFVEIKLDDIDVRQASKQSLMPNELINTLNEEEAKDLIAYLLSRGNPNAPMFKK